MMIRRAHRMAGWLVVAVFIGTGMYLRWWLPPEYVDQHAVRFLLRSNHVYILMAGLLNLFAACALDSTATWKKGLQITGSLMLLGSPLLLIPAFIREAPEPDLHRPLTTMGVLWCAIGTILRAGFAPWRRPA